MRGVEQTFKSRERGFRHLRTSLLIGTALSCGLPDGSGTIAYAQQPQPSQQTQTPAQQETPAGQPGVVPIPTVTVQAPGPRPRVVAPKQAPPQRRAVAQPAPAAPPAPRLLPPVAPGTGPVRGYVATQSMTGTKTDTPILETPQSISVVTKDQIVAQGAETISQALLYTPGITSYLFGVNSLFDTIKVRGFEVPLFLDGLRLPPDGATTFVYPRIVPYGLERIEVLRGPSSGLYGQTPPGGLVNMISKRPTDTPQNEVGVQYGSFNRRQMTFDFSGPADARGEWLYRIVGLGRLSDTQLDFQQDNQYFIAPSFTWRNIDTRFTFLSSAQEYSGKGYQQYVPGIGTLVSNPNGRIPYSRYLGEPDNDYFRLRQQSVGWAFEHRFDDVLQFRQNVRYTHADVKLLALREEGLLADLRTTPRSELYVFGRTHTFAIDNQFQADIATGPALHKVLWGYDYYRTRSDSGFSFAPGTPLDVFAPVYGAPQVPVDAMFPLLHNTGDLRQTGFYIQDQIKLDRWILSLTGRSDQANNTVIDKLGTPAPTINQNDSALTGRAGLTYVFPNGVAPYVVYSTSFQPAPGVDFQGAPFKPTTGESKEIGIKYQPVGMNALFTAALYDTTQQNVLTPDPAHPFFSVQLGEIKVKGFEFEASVSINDRLDIVAGYSRLDPRVTQTTGPNIGQNVANVALETASLWGMYTMRDGPFAGWGVGAGVRYVGISYADIMNTIEVSPYTLFDAAVTYDFSYLSRELRGLKFQLNATNLANRYYVTSCFDLRYCSLGAERTILASLKYQWPQSDVKAPGIYKAMASAR